MRGASALMCLFCLEFIQQTRLASIYCPQFALFLSLKHISHIHTVLLSPLTSITVYLRGLTSYVVNDKITAVKESSDPDVAIYWRSSYIKA